MIEKFEIGRWYEFGSKAFEVLDINPEEDRLLVRYHGEEQPVRRFISVQVRLVEPRDVPPEPPTPPPTHPNTSRGT